MQNPLIRTFDIGAWLQASTKSRHLVSREVGRQVREAVEEQLRTTAEGAVTTLDCSGVDHLDFAAADECFAKLILRVQGMEYGDIFIVLAGLTPTQEESVVVALERKKLAALVQRKDSPEIIGDLNPYLRDAFTILVRAKVMTARDLADGKDRSISLAATIFLNLHKARLVQRISERLRDGGRQFIYQVVEGSVFGPDSPQRRSSRGKP